MLRNCDGNQGSSIFHLQPSKIYTIFTYYYLDLTPGLGIRSFALVTLYLKSDRIELLFT